MSQAKIKEMAKQLYGKVNNMGRSATTSEIKKAFPKFRASVAEHWELLILKLLGYNSKVNKVPQKSAQEIREEQMTKMQQFLTSQGIQNQRKDSYPRYQIICSHKGYKLGILGYSLVTETWFCELGGYNNAPMIHGDFMKMAETLTAVCVKQIAQINRQYA